MKVFFTASYHGKEKYQKNYDVVRNTIKLFKVELVSPEENNYHLMLDTREQKIFSNPDLLRTDKFWHYEAIRNGIHWAEAVIIEISQEDFQLGHEVSLALMEKKPVLCLSVNDDFSKKIHHDYFFAAKYSSSNIQAIIQDFFAKVRSLTLSRRFNLFLYPHQVDYLEKVAKKYGTNMSEYIRKLIDIDRRGALEQGQSDNS